MFGRGELYFRKVQKLHAEWRWRCIIAQHTKSAHLISIPDLPHFSDQSESVHAVVNQIRRSWKFRLVGWYKTNSIMRNFTRGLRTLKTMCTLDVCLLCGLQTIKSQMKNFFLIHCGLCADWMKVWFLREFFPY